MATFVAEGAHVGDDEVLRAAVAWAASRGLSIAKESGGSGGLAFTHAPFTLSPRVLPRAAFENAGKLAKTYNKLVDSVSRHPTYLERSLRSVLSGDPFTARLYAIHEKVKSEMGAKAYASRTHLGIHRSDYMLDEPTGKMLQIELNTIASSFGCLSTYVSRLHEYLLERFPERYGSLTSRSGHLPPNHAMFSIASALAEAVTAYRNVRAGSAAPDSPDAPSALTAGPTPSGKWISFSEDQIREARANSVDGGSNAQPSKNRDLVVVFVVQSGERNFFDQRLLEFALWDNHRVKAVRRTLGELNTEATMDTDGALTLQNNQLEVAAVYFRAGYTPDDYPTEKEWDARLMLERSNAVCCPSISYHLVGAKKVQQTLAKGNDLEMFLTDREAAMVRASFAGLWSLGADADESVVTDAKKNPEAYVVKPQREGGGNNIYGADVAVALNSMPPEELSAHILMQRIMPAAAPSVLVKDGSIVRGDAVSELGIYSVYIGNGSEVRLNRAAGHLLRTKLSGVDEGGVATGFSVLDSPYLV